MRNFKKLLIWIKGMELVDLLYESASHFPDSEKFGLRSQVLSAGVSIPSNIAEGSAKRSPKDYVRYLTTSLGSAYELETQLLIIEKRKWFPEDLIARLLELTEEEQKMISAFIDRVS
ncbi:MAG TPA: four helix bundle protein [Ohtaekwangia sp.]|nr:four helix bundle protein [Ohtaekwangia sp.]